MTVWASSTTVNPTFSWYVLDLSISLHLQSLRKDSGLPKTKSKDSATIRSFWLMFWPRKVALNLMSLSFLHCSSIIVAKVATTDGLIWKHYWIRIVRPRFPSTSPCSGEHGNSGRWTLLRFCQSSYFKFITNFSLPTWEPPSLLNTNCNNLFDWSKNES